MSKFWIVFTREYTQIVKKKSFIITIFAIPLLMMTFTILPAMLARQKSSTTEQLRIIDRSGLEIGEQFKEEIADFKLEDSDLPYYNVKEIYNIAVDDVSEFTRVDSTLSQMIQNKELKYYLVIDAEPHLFEHFSGLLLRAGLDGALHQSACRC